MRRIAALALLCLLTACQTQTQAQTQAGHKRALLVGINDYSGARVQRPRHAGAPGRDLPNLDGAVTDVETMKELLVARYGFDRADIVVLPNEQATRAAILEALHRHLLAPAKKGDVLLFYYSGHGSQVKNSRSAERDHLDESLVPADTRLGAPDIRDKELAPIFNDILGRGARLTIILDACHSGSGARSGLDSTPRVRGVSSDPRDVADPKAVARPEDRGALVLSAAQDLDLAYETIDEQRVIHGAFSWALARAIRDAAPGESATDTFLRARARLRIDAPAQEPVLAGRADVRLAPLLTDGSEPRARRTRPVVAVERVRRDGTYVLQGGWIDGVTVGSELRVAGQPETRLEVTALAGITRSEARVVASTRAALRPGTLLEVGTWAEPPGRPLRVWMPRATDAVLGDARALRDQALRRGIEVLDDPTEATPKHLLRWRNDEWELVTDGRGTAADRVQQIPAGDSLFLQLPVSPRVADAIGKLDGVEMTAGPETADYILAGRFTGSGIEYAWIRPLVTQAGDARAVMPARSAWNAGGGSLRSALERLCRIQGWHELASPAAVDPHYRLAIRRSSDGRLVENEPLSGGDVYQFLLRVRENAPGPIYARYVYAFVIDRDGTGVLLFPALSNGSVENLLPVTQTPGEPLRDPPAEVPLGRFRVQEPYGLDTYFLLLTDEPVATLAGLEGEGVRGLEPSPKTALEKLLARSASGTRGPGDSARTPPNWSIEKVTYQSVPPRRASR